MIHVDKIFDSIIEKKKNDFNFIKRSDFYSFKFNVSGNYLYISSKYYQIYIKIRFRNLEDLEKKLNQIIDYCIYFRLLAFNFFKEPLDQYFDPHILQPHFELRSLIQSTKFFKAIYKNPFYAQLANLKIDPPFIYNRHNHLRGLVLKDPTVTYEELSDFYQNYIKNKIRIYDAKPKLLKSFSGIELRIVSDNSIDSKTSKLVGNGKIYALRMIFPIFTSNVDFAVYLNLVYHYLRDTGELGKFNAILNHYRIGIL